MTTGNSSWEIPRQPVPTTMTTAVANTGPAARLEYRRKGLVRTIRPVVAEAYFPAGVGWYRKTFGAPPSWQGKCVSICFEGVYMSSEVFLNGKSLGVHPYGYTTFRYDLSPYLDFNRENVLAVRVDNSHQMNCRWYSGSGIYRHVWLVVTDPVHIATLGSRNHNA